MTEDGERGGVRCRGRRWTSRSAGRTPRRGACARSGHVRGDRQRGARSRASPSSVIAKMKISLDIVRVRVAVAGGTHGKDARVDLAETVVHRTR